MKKITIKIASLVLMAVVMTGCNVSNTANDTPGASGGAVSGSIAAEDKEVELTDQERSCLENSDNRYDVLYYKGGDFLAQYRLDGTLVKKEKTDIKDIEWVTDEWLYYTIEDRDADDVLWRIPIKKTEQGDHLQKGKKEKLLKEYSIRVDYVTDSYIILELYDRNGISSVSGICKYDCETGKLTVLIPGKEMAECFWASEYPLMWKGGLFYEGYEKLYFLNPEEEQVSSLYSFADSECTSGYALTGNELYFLANNNLYRCKCSSKKTECVIPEMKFLKAVQSLKLGNIKYIDMEEMYLNQGRLYFGIEPVWKKKERISRKEIFYSKEELFSVSLDDLEKIQHEDKLMDYLNQKGKYENEKYAEDSDYIYHTSYLEGFANGKVVASYLKGEWDDDKYRYVLYDLQTGEISDMAEKKLPEEYEEFVW